MLKKKPKIDTKKKDLKSFVSRKEQREIRKKRRMKENKFFEITENAKKIWEELRRGDCSKVRKHDLIENLLRMIKGKVREIVRAHDTVRVIQCVLRYGTDDQRSALFNELKEDILALTKTKYAKYFIMKMLKYGSAEEKAFIIKSFYGKVKELLKHGHASQVLEYAYNEVANMRQRGHLVQEFYGPEYVIFKDENKIGLSKILSSRNEEQKRKTLAQMKEEILQLIHKGAIKHSITHHLIREYFRECPKESLAEIITSLRELVVEILHTKDGSRIACECIWFGSPKDRKMTVKSFRKYVPKIACEERGHLALLAIFDAVDDTKLIEKTILGELFAAENVPILLGNKYAVKVFEYLISPRDQKFFHKDYIDKLSPGDNNPYSKKSQESRWSELRDLASPHLIDMVKDHVEKFFALPSSSLLLANIVNNVKGDRERAMLAIIAFFNQIGPYRKSVNEEELHLIEKGYCCFVLRRLITYKHEKQSFCDIFCQNIDLNVLQSYVECNRGCFLILSLLENTINNEAKQRLLSLVSLRKKLNHMEFKGAKLLYEKLSG